MEKDNVKKELEEIAPGLVKLRKSNSYSLPADYFETLPQEISQKIGSGKRTKNSIFNYSPVLQTVITGIAAVLIIFAGYQLFLTNSNEVINGFADDLVYEEHLAWYSEYQTGVYYDILLSDAENAAEGLDDQIYDDQVIEYLSDYEYYYMEQAPDIMEPDNPFSP